MTQQWSRRHVLACMKQLARGGNGLKQAWKNHPEVYEAAMNYYGKWTTALRAAGFSPRFAEKLTKEEVLEAIQIHQQQNKGLQGLHKRAPWLVHAACKYFCTWNQALRAAGIEPKPLLQYPKEWVIAGIQARHQQGLRLTHVWKEDKHLYAVALRRFGNWATAMTAAGFQAKTKRKWTKDSILQALLTWYRDSSVSLSRLDPGLKVAIEQYFGSLMYPRKILPAR